MEIENVEVMEEASQNQEQDIMGGGDIDIVIEELNGGHDNVEEPIVGDSTDGNKNEEVEKDDHVEDVEIENINGVGNEEIENIDQEEEKEVENIECTDDTGRDTTETVNDEENENIVVDNVDIVEEKEDEIGIKSVEVDIEEKPIVIDVPGVDTKTAHEVPKENIPNKDENKENGGFREANNNSIKDSISKFGAPVKRKEKGMFKVVQTEKCAACQKTVYAMEKLEMNGHIYHKNCFKCSHCSARLTAKTFSMNEGVIYCVNHFKQLFARKGNYDEGFGRQQYKKKWQGDKPEGATA